MADPRGFLTTPRQGAPTRPVDERVRDWQEVYAGGGIGRALLPVISKQAGRCMDCGIPFCHDGCPLGNLIPEWNDLVWRDDWYAAIERLHANNFPEFTGRLCPRRARPRACWGSTRSGNDQERRSGHHRPRLRRRMGDAATAGRLSDRTVAVVGSGPAGLAAAATHPAGHTVAVFERADRAGGLLGTAFPSSRWKNATWTAALTRCGRKAPSSAPESMSASGSPASSSGNVTTPSCWRSAPPPGATCRFPDANSLASIRRWSSYRKRTSGPGRVDPGSDHGDRQGRRDHRRW